VATLQASYKDELSKGDKAFKDLVNGLSQRVVTVSDSLNKLQGTVDAIDGATTKQLKWQDSRIESEVTSLQLKFESEIKDKTDKIETGYKEQLKILQNLMIANKMPPDLSAEVIYLRNKLMNFKETLADTISLSERKTN